MISMRLFPDQPFAETEEFLGNLAQGDLISHDLHFAIQFNLARNDVIKGKILGNPSAYDKVAKLFLLPGPPLQLRSESTIDFATQFRSDEVFLESISRPYAGLERSPEAVGAVAEFHLGNLTFTTERPSADISGRKVTFLLTGPTIAWDARWVAEVSHSGERKIIYPNPKLELQNESLFEIQILPRFFYATTLSSEGHALNTHVLSVQFSTVTSTTELSDSDFLSQAKSTIDDLLLLSSLISRRWTAWYAYLLETPRLLEWHLKRTRDCSSKEPEHHETLLAPGQIRPFLTKALHRLRTLRSQHFDLFMPIVYCVAGSEAKHVEEKFTSLFLALERIKDLFARSNTAYNQILADPEFHSLTRNICDLVRQNVDSKGRRKLFYEKVRELNRPSFLSVLEAFLQKQDILWKDLYPTNATFSLIKTRDKLFHSSDIIDHQELILELYRLRALVERLLLSLLGSRDFSRAPISYIHDNITKTRPNGNAV
jgi:hypothetical protein